MKFLEFQSDDLRFHERLGSFKKFWYSVRYENKKLAARKSPTYENEVQVMSVLSNKHIIKFHGAVITSPYYCLVIECTRQDSLYDYIADKKVGFQINFDLV